MIKAKLLSKFDPFIFAGTTPTTEHKQPPQHVDKEKLFDRQASQADVSRPFLKALAESRVQDNAVRTFLAYIDRYCRSHYLVTPIEFPPDHPVEEVKNLNCTSMLKFPKNIPWQYFLFGVTAEIGSR